MTPSPKPLSITTPTSNNNNFCTLVLTSCTSQEIFNYVDDTGGSIRGSHHRSTRSAQSRKSHILQNDNNKRQNVFLPRLDSRNDSSQGGGDDDDRKSLQRVGVETSREGSHYHSDEKLVVARKKTNCTNNDDACLSVRVGGNKPKPESSVFCLPKLAIKSSHKKSTKSDIDQNGRNGSTNPTTMTATTTTTTKTGAAATPSPSVSLTEEEMWYIFRSEGQALMTKRVMEGWLLLPVYCKGKNCDCAPLVALNGSLGECCVCHGNGSGKDGLYSETFRGVTKNRIKPDSNAGGHAQKEKEVTENVDESVEEYDEESYSTIDYSIHDEGDEYFDSEGCNTYDEEEGQKSSGDKDSSKDFVPRNLERNFEELRVHAIKEIRHLVLMGWTLLNISCPYCVMPLVVETEGGPETCVFCGDVANTLKATELGRNGMSFAREGGSVSGYGVGDQEKNKETYVVATHVEKVEESNFPSKPNSDKKVVTLVQEENSSDISSSMPIATKTKEKKPGSNEPFEMAVAALPPPPLSTFVPKESRSQHKPVPEGKKTISSSSTKRNTLALSDQRIKEEAYMSVVSVVVAHPLKSSNRSLPSRFKSKPSPDAMLLRGREKKDKNKTKAAAAAAAASVVSAAEPNVRNSSGKSSTVVSTECVSRFSTKPTPEMLLPR